jgi:hypothetical protein
LGARREGSFTRRGRRGVGKAAQLVLMYWSSSFWHLPKKGGDAPGFATGLRLPYRSKVLLLTES